MQLIESPAVNLRASGTRALLKIEHCVVCKVTVSSGTVCPTEKERIQHITKNSD